MSRHDHHSHHHGDDADGSDERSGERSRRRLPFGGPFGGPGPFEAFGGFGPGGPFGPGGSRGRRGGPFGRGGPRARRGDVRSAVLGLLAQAPSNGYGLIRAIGERTDGAWTPSPGSIYPTLAQLVDEGLITQAEGPRSPYELTEAGRQHVSEHSAEIDAAFAAARGEGDDASEGASELVSAFRKLMLAAAPLRGEVTPEQRAAAVSAIDTARRELHRIFAE